MTVAPKLMSVDEFLAWAEGQDGRWEIYEGVPYCMAAERTRHATAKYRAQRALDEAIRRAGVSCSMLADGPLVRVSERTAYEPDALVYCGPVLPGDAIEVPHPVIVVEVTSPSTARNDSLRKLAGYFQVPSVQHYLIIDPEGGPIVHHQRQADGTILTRLLAEGQVRLDPPGLSFSVAELFD